MVSTSTWSVAVVLLITSIYINKKFYEHVLLLYTLYVALYLLY
jgi:hypothetical protein